MLPLARFCNVAYAAVVDGLPERGREHVDTVLYTPPPETVRAALTATDTGQAVPAGWKPPWFDDDVADAGATGRQVVVSDG